MKHHSTESAILKVHTDIIISMNKGEVTALTLLDLSVAIDTIDHATLPNRLGDRLVWNIYIWAGSNLVFFPLAK